jgi:hypothetical protein
VPLGILGEQTKKNSLWKESLNEVRNVVWVVIGVVVAGRPRLPR